MEHPVVECSERYPKCLWSSSNQYNRSLVCGKNKINFKPISEFPSKTHSSSSSVWVLAVAPLGFLDLVAVKTEKVQN